MRPFARARSAENEGNAALEGGIVGKVITIEPRRRFAQPDDSSADVNIPRRVVWEPTRPRVLFQSFGTIFAHHKLYSLSLYSSGNLILELTRRSHDTYDNKNNPCTNPCTKITWREVRQTDSRVLKDQLTRTSTRWEKNIQEATRHIYSTCANIKVS